MNQKDVIKKVFDRLMAMPAEQLRAEIKKFGVDGIGTFLEENGIDLCEQLKTPNKSIQTDAGIGACSICTQFAGKDGNYCPNCGRKLRR